MIARVIQSPIMHLLILRGIIDIFNVPILDIQQRWKKYVFENILYL